MIKDKNIFECFFLEDCIWLPHYVYWGPPSHGYARRKAAFLKTFPNIRNFIATKEDWEAMKQTCLQGRRVYQYHEDTGYLELIDNKNFFTNAYGFVVKPGQKFIRDNKIYKIEKLEIIKWVGLVGVYTEDGREKKINISTMVYDKENNYWSEERK